ncbi:MAG TPA: nuclear transport factor 2 family protein [Anaeromyxobacteraceae bacterium]|nr:nuclear transport factor 2 family protein [Anaeromyxobacteraceae bacterium]
MTAQGRPTPSIAAMVEGYVKAFDENDLDRVMTHFADDAVYHPPAGDERMGLAAIRRELEPQFRGVYGAMRFDELDRLVDETSRKALTRWICRHDLTHARPTTLALKIERVVVGALVGTRFGWEGVDVFHFDAGGKIKALFSYGTWARRPRLRKELGVPLPPMPRPHQAG